MKIYPEAAPTDPGGQTARQLAHELALQFGWRRRCPNGPTDNYGHTADCNRLTEAITTRDRQHEVALADLRDLLHRDRTGLAAALTGADIPETKEPTK